LAILADSAKLLVQQRTHRLDILPIVIVYLNNVCDSRCGSCSIWRNNDALKAPAERQMTDSLLETLYDRSRAWHTREVLLSGGEPLLHPRFPEALDQFGKRVSRVSVITNGLLLSSMEPAKVAGASAFYISFDAPDRESYLQIRGVDGFERLTSSLRLLARLNPRPAIVARCTLQRANISRIPELTQKARKMGFDQISFLAVDVGSSAFSRDRYGPAETESLLPQRQELRQLEGLLRALTPEDERFMEGGAEKLRRLLRYFLALRGEGEFPVVRCNTPWFSTVVETTGAIRGCFFQPVIGTVPNINGPSAIRFRRSLRVADDETCRHCVCSKDLGLRDFLKM